MIKKMSISILLAITLAIGMWTVAAPAPAARAATECVWSLKASTSQSYTGYYVSVWLYEYIYYQGAAYCNAWYAKASVTIDAEYGPGSFTPQIIDGGGTHHSGSTFKWSQQSYSQSWTGTSPYIDTRCAEGNGYLSLSSGTMRNFTTANACGY